MNRQEYDKQYYHEHKDIMNQISKQWKKDNPDKWKKIQAKNNKNQYEEKLRRISHYDQWLEEIGIKGIEFE